MNRKYDFLVIILAFILLAVSCVSKQVPVPETYHETQYKVERIEGVSPLTPKIKWSANLYGEYSIADISTSQCNGYAPLISYYGYEIDTSQYSQSNVKVSYSFTGNPKLSHFTYLYVHDLTGIGQIILPTNLEFGKSNNLSQYKTALDYPTKGQAKIEYIPTLEEQKWLESYHAIVGVGNIDAGAAPEKALHLLASFTPSADTINSSTCSIDTSYTPNNGGATDLGVALFGKVYRYNCYIAFDSSKLKQFAIITRTTRPGAILCTSGTSAFCSAIEISDVQLVYTTEKKYPIK